MRSVRRVTAIAAAAVVLGLGFAVGSASPAAAADRPGGPECQSYTRWDNIVGGRYTAWFPTTGYWSWNTRCSLQLGDRGAGVRVLQQALNACYGERLTVDGIYGYGTKDAVEDAALEEVGNHWDEYTDVLRTEMDWPYWRYDDRGAHRVCQDNSYL